MVNQDEYDRDKPKLTAVPARTRFISYEPMLGRIDTKGNLGGVHWVIAGGESGPHARIAPDGAAESMHEQYAAAGVPYFFKQHGGTSKDKGGCSLSGMEVKAWPIAA